MKTSELQGAALDWAVAKCEGIIGDVSFGEWEQHPTDFDSDWSQGGPIIEREGMTLQAPFDGAVRHGDKNGPVWVALIPGKKAHDVGFAYRGPTPLIAAMRCYVASNLGDEVKIPKELE